MLVISSPLPLDSHRSLVRHPRSTYTRCQGSNTVSKSSITNKLPRATHKACRGITCATIRTYFDQPSDRRIFNSPRSDHADLSIAGDRRPHFHTPRAGQERGLSGRLEREGPLITWESDYVRVGRMGLMRYTTMSSSKSYGRRLRSHAQKRCSMSRIG